jgi:plastocyanin
VYSLTQQPEAVLTLTVQNAGSPYPATQSAYNQQAQVAEANDLSAGMSSIASFPYANGGTHLAAGIAPGLASGPPSTATVLRFLDANSLSNAPVTIPVGTTLTWTNQSNNEPHDVVFPVAGSTPPPNLSPFAPASGGNTYDGSTLVDSGVMMPGQSFSLTFTRAGTYQYYCLFHDDAGMVGTVIVQ